MRKQTDSEKLRDMVRSILPSTDREGARKAKAIVKRSHRRSVRAELHTEDAQETAVDFFRDVSMRSLVSWRRGHDKLNHFMRWCETLTEGMSDEEALIYVRGILPKNLIGDHAYGHWESYVEFRDRRRFIRSGERGRRAAQSYRDSAIVRLRRALHVDPTLHARLNAEIKSRKLPDEPRRMFLGEHDIEAFVDDVRCRKVERNALFRLIEEIEKGGLTAALRVLGVWGMRCEAWSYPMPHTSCLIPHARYHPRMASEEKTSIRNELFIIVLAVVSAIILIIDLAAELSPEDREFLGRVDFVIALLFLTEFTVRLVRSPDRKTFLKKYWWELLASIPITNELTQSLRGLRLLRVVRLLRILRVVRLAVRLRILAERSERFAGKTHIIAITTTAGLVVLTGSLLFHFFESGTNQNVKSLWDSFWWAMVTVSTVGYGDIYPVTTGGRLTAMVMMVIGVGVLGSYVATITNYVVGTKSTSIE